MAIERERQFFLEHLTDLLHDYNALAIGGVPREAAATLVLAAVVSRLEDSLWRMSQSE